MTVPPKWICYEFVKRILIYLLPVKATEVGAAEEGEEDATSRI